jgi:hypothetical protein
MNALVDLDTTGLLFQCASYVPILTATIDPTHLSHSNREKRGERIKEVASATEVMKLTPKNPKVIDLGSATVLPGLIDCQAPDAARLEEKLALSLHPTETVAFSMARFEVKLYF